MQFDISQLARRSATVFPKAETPRCIFCGEGPQWFDTRSAKGEILIHGCRCRWAVAVRDGKLAFQMLVRPDSGKLVITRCSPELWSPLIETGLVVGALGAVLAKELDETSRQAMRDAVSAYQARNAKPQPETLRPPRVTLSAALPPPNASDSVTQDGSVTPAAADSVTCEECGKPFTPLRKTARYCSVACRMKAHRR